MKTIEQKNRKKLQGRNRKYLNQLRKKPTKAEMILGKYLFDRKVYFIFQKGFFTPFHRIADFYFPVRSLIVEVDGGYHKNIEEKDIYKDYRWALDRGIQTLRIKNEQVYDGSFVNLLEPFINEPIEKDTQIHNPTKWRFYIQR